MIIRYAKCSPNAFINRAWCVTVLQSSFASKITINEDDIEEKFVRSSGPGGQHVNKTNSKVQLLHKPSGIQVSSQEHRDLQLNRKEARKKLRDQLDIIENREDSKVMMKIAKLQRRKAKSRSRSKKKYDTATSAGDTNDDENDKNGIT